MALLTVAPVVSTPMSECQNESTGSQNEIEAVDGNAPIETMYKIVT
jgi:hypothetical protein